MPSQPRSRVRPGLALALLALLLPAPAARAEEPGRDPRPQTVLLELGAGETASLTLPPGAAPGRPQPVAVLLPDADGPGPRSALYGQRLLDNGIALLEANFGGGDPDAPPASAPVAARLGLALAILAADPRLDPRRVAVVGLGEGARAALLGLAAGAPVAALALLYPGCDAPLTMAAGRAPGAPRVLILHGDEDPANDPGGCAELAGAFPVQAGVRHRVLAGATYAWDAYGMVRPGGVALLPDPGGRARRAWSQPDPRTTEVAADRVLGFVLAALGRP